MSVDIVDVLGYYWDELTKDKSTMPIASAMYLKMSLEQVIEYLAFRRDYQGDRNIDTTEVIDQLIKIIEQFQVPE